jgi:hypothetical protein
MNHNKQIKPYSQDAIDEKKGGCTGDVSTSDRVQIPTGPFNIVFNKHRSLGWLTLFAFSEDFVAVVVTYELEAKFC